MDNWKQKIKDAYEAGKAAYGFKGSAPHDNKEFMATVPNCTFSDTLGVKVRQEMYKAYIKGWTDANLSNGDNEINSDEDISGQAVINGKWNGAKWTK